MECALYKKLNLFILFVSRLRFIFSPKLVAVGLLVTVLWLFALVEMSLLSVNVMDS